MNKETKDKIEMFKSVWKNGATIRIVYYKNRQKGEVNSDRIHLLFKPEDANERGWIMNIQDAVDVIYGLSKACSWAIENEIPTHEKGAL